MPLADQVRDIFRAPRPNVVLASLAPLVRELSSFPEIKHMIERAFTDFIQKTLLRIPNVELQPIPFVGSVALNFSHELEHCLNREGLTAGTCDASPISRLVIYHQKHTST